MLNIVLNTSTIRVGGALQVAINVLKASLSYKDVRFFYLTNKVVYEQINTPSERTLILDDYPSNIFNQSIRRDVRKFIKSINPELVYSIGSPSYLNFGDVKEVQRLTNPWIIYDTSLVLSKFSFINRFRTFLEVIVKKQFLKNTIFFITQTEDAKKAIVSNLNKLPNNVYCVSNTLSYNLVQYLDLKIERNYLGNINLLVFSANYPHKNIDILVKVANRLRDRNIHNIKFVVTIPFEEWPNSKLFKDIEKFSLNEYFVNKGKVDIGDIPNLFLESHILLLPTLLEVFSATFLEAMAFQIPIITTDLSFNTCVCGDSALYFNDYFEGKDIDDKIFKLIENKELRNNLITNAQSILKKYINEENFYFQHFRILENICNGV